ncbi:MAG: hypothetical protein WCL11_27675 [Verrucomicrobiota bacterium]
MQRIDSTLIAAFVISVLQFTPTARGTVVAAWNYNSTVTASYLAATTGNGTTAGYGQGSPSAPLTSLINNGSASDPGTLQTTIAGTYFYDRSITVNPPLLTAANLSVGIKWTASTAGYTNPIKITWSQTVGYRSSRYWQILASTDGTTFVIPTGGIGSNISSSVTSYDSSNTAINGNATATISNSGLIDIRTLNFNSLVPTSTTTNSITANGWGFLDNLSFTLPTGQGYENNPNFAIAIVGAFDPSYLGSNGTLGLVSSYAGINSTDLTNGYNRASASGGSMRIDLVTISSTAVPEASTLGLMVLGLASLTAVGLLRRRIATSALAGPTKEGIGNTEPG